MKCGRTNWNYDMCNELSRGEQVFMDNQINIQLVLIYLFIVKTNHWMEAWHLQGLLSDSEEVLLWEYWKYYWL